MPNYVSVNIKVSGEEKIVNEFFSKCFNCKEFDFDKIIPEPRTKEECDPDCIANANSHITIDNDRPWFNWYDWHCKHWGTKWNACSCDLDRKNNAFTFDTAWSLPVPVLSAMSKMFPELVFDIDWIEEQGVVDLGSVRIKDDLTISSHIPESESKEAYELMFKFWGNREDYVYDADNDTYMYADDETADEYDSFCDKWHQEHSGKEFEGQEPPSIDEWYNNDRKMKEVNA